jgi:rhomboid protease GluP
MATCVRCGRELPAFSFGETSNLCANCKQMATFIPPQVASPPPPPSITQQAYQFPVTVVLLTINLLVFAAMVFQRSASFMHPDDFQLLRWGADFGPLSLGGQPWRILTSNYVHIGFVHILVNMWALWQLGRVTERIFGRWIYFVIYTASGISGSLLSLLHDPMRISAGASGALFGIMGALIAALYLGKLPFPKRVRDGLLKNLVWVAVINLGLGASIPGIDNAGHVGGLVMGLALGAIIGPHLMQEPIRRAGYNRLTLVAAVFLLIGFGILVKQKRGYVADVTTARVALGGNRPDVAISLLQPVIARDPNNLEALNLLAQAYMGKKDYAHAQGVLERMVKIDPDNFSIKYILGLSYAGQHQYEDAHRVFDELTRQRPNNSDAWTLLGASLDALGREEDAINAYQKAISLNPQDAETYRELGLANAKLNHLPAALEALKKAAELDPNNSGIQKDLSDVYTVMGNTAEAAAASHRADELSKSATKKP